MNTRIPSKDEAESFNLFSQAHIDEIENKGVLEGYIAKCKSEIFLLENEIHHLLPNTLNPPSEKEESEVDEIEEKEKEKEKEKGGDEMDEDGDVEMMDKTGEKKEETSQLSENKEKEKEKEDAVTTWKCPEESVPIRADVRTFNFDLLASKQLEYGGRLFDVIMMDPPWQLASSNPTRGVAIGYDQLSDTMIGNEYSPFFLLPL